MAEAVVMPALEMAQETGVLVRWLKRQGESVEKGEPVMEVETDKATMEIESPASGLLGGVTASEGESVPVGRTIAWILAPGETPPEETEDLPSGRQHSSPQPPATPLARRIAEEEGVDLAEVTSSGRRIEKADVLAYLEKAAPEAVGAAQGPDGRGGEGARLLPASPKARRIASERGLRLASLVGTGPGGAVLTRDLESQAGAAAGGRAGAPGETSEGATYERPGSLWQIMASRMSESWSGAPHFYLMREVDAARLLEWRARAARAVERKASLKLTVSDLLVRSIGATLRDHPRLNGSWDAGVIRLNREVNIGIATATDEGLVVPVIRGADAASLAEIAARRGELVERARARKLRASDIADGTFTLSNLGMYGVDAFNAIVNPPQAAILAVGRITDRVVPVDGVPEVRPTVIMTLACDHRVVDGARAARFLDDLAHTIEDPWSLLA